MKIKLNEMMFYGFHGVHIEERKLGQRFVVSLTLVTDNELDSKIHQLDDTVDYTKVYSAVKEIMETHQFQLLESCANTIVDTLLNDFPLIQKIKICIQKPSVPIQGSLKSVEVELKKSRSISPAPVSKT